MTDTSGHSLEYIASVIGAKIKGDAACRVFSINTIQDATDGDIAFLSNPKYRGFLSETKASAVILAPELADDCQVNALVSDNPYLGFALTAQLLDSTPQQTPGIHASAVISPTATVAESASIAANAVIDDGAVVHDNVQVGAGCYIGCDSVIGRNSRLFANVTIYHGVEIGQCAIIHGGTTIGSDGFGFAHDTKQWIKIPQLGGVKIGEHFECGANCTIDRGAINDTLVGDGVKLDNSCHLAHNVDLGSHSAMAGFSGIAGSSKVGANCTISGRVSVLGHIELSDNVHITAGSIVAKSLDAGAYSSGGPLMTNRDWKRNVARIRQLDDMSKKIKELEKQMKQLIGENSNDGK